MDDDEPLPYDFDTYEPRIREDGALVWWARCRVVPLVEVD